MKNKDLLFDISDKVATITINRQMQRNAISGETVALFHEYLDDAAGNDAIRVVCITGAGEKAFCSGADLSGSMTKGGEEEKKTFHSYADLLVKLSRFPKPTVAKINGHCLAGGTGFMLACDIVIAREDAKFGTPEVNVGLFPLMIGALIFRNVLRKKAMEMILLGEKLTAREALEMGMITRIVPHDQLDKTVNDVLSALAAKSPIAVKLGKQAFDKASEMSFTDAVEHLAATLVQVAKTEDAREGITAFIEKRQPVFKGK